jgi:hypothetical protein
MTTTYLAGAALEQLDHAQSEVDRHVASGADGRCLECAEDQPCTALRRAHATFNRYGLLPARRPGLASRGVTAPGGFNWLDPATPRRPDGR